MSVHGVSPADRGPRCRNGIAPTVAPHSEPTDTTGTRHECERCAAIGRRRCAVRRRLMSRGVRATMRLSRGLPAGSATSAGDVRASAVLRGRSRREAGDRPGGRPAARAAATRLARAGSGLRRPAAPGREARTRSAVSGASRSVAVLVRLREDRRDQGADLVGLVQHVGFGQVDQVSVQCGGLRGEPSVLVRLAPHMAGQQFPAGRVDMVRGAIRWRRATLTCADRSTAA